VHLAEGLRVEHVLVTEGLGAALAAGAHHLLVAPEHVCHQQLVALPAYV